MRHGFLAAILMGASLTAVGCASTEPREDPFVVVEENASISDRSLIRSTSILDDDVLLIRAGVNDIYRVRLFPGCADFSDIGTGARLEETGIGVDRGTRFTIGGTTCPVRSIERVEERRRQPATAG